jgi:UDP-N-acetylglucosamine 4,6-dehydratase/5-epimerase
MLNKLFDEVSELVNGKNIFITGGTGTFGHKLTHILLNQYSPNKVIIFSRDEFKQYNMKQIFSESKYPNIRYFIGDVRDYERLETSTQEVDILFHAAAMKQVDTIEYNPLEAIRTNIYGTENVIKAAIKNKVKKVIGVSTDKCVSPVNLYGATKLCLEKLIIHANLISGKDGTIFSILRYGNVINSRGSVVPLFLKQKENKCFTVTDDKMTRFTLTIEQAIRFVLNCASIMIGGEVFVPILPSYNIIQLAKCIDNEAEIKVTGIRPGEKLHEAMISSTESYKTIIKEDYMVVLPEIKINKNYEEKYGTNYRVRDEEYSSGNNSLISDSDLTKMIEM